LFPLELTVTFPLERGAIRVPALTGGIEASAANAARQAHTIRREIFAGFSA